MRRHWAIAAFLAIAVIVLFLQAHQRHVIPPDECSGEYVEFMHSEHVAAAFTRDFHLGDSIILNVTTLRARDSAGWAELDSRFSLHMEEHNEIYRKELEEGIDIILSKRYIPDTTLPEPERKRYFLAASPLLRTVNIYHTENKSQEIDLLRYQMEKTIQSTITTNNQKNEKNI